MENSQELHVERLRALGKYLILKRSELGATQRMMAQRSGLPQSHISRIESGSNERDMGLRVVPMLALGYEVPIFDILKLIFPELAHEAPSPEVLNVQIRPNKAYEQSVTELQALVSASGSKLEGLIGAALEDLKRQQNEQQESIDEIRNALAGLSSVATDFSAIREDLAALSVSRQGRIPYPHSIEDDDDEELL